MDYHAVDPRFGSWEDVERLGRSFRLVFDLVLNHASAQGVWFRKFLAGEPPFSRYFLTRSPQFDASLVFRPRTHPLLTRKTRTDGSDVWVWTTFSEDQVDLDFGEPEVLLAMVEVVLLYLKKGAKVLRLDAVAFGWKEDGTNCLDRPQVHLLVKIFRALLDEAAIGAALLTETNLPQAINDSYFGEGDEAGLVYQFALPPLAAHAFVGGKADWLARWASTLPRPVEGRVFVNFLSSHDGIGVTPVRGLLPAEELESLIQAVRRRGGLISERATPGGSVPYELNTTFFDVIAEPSAPPEERVRAFLSCHAIMVALSGVPALWFLSLVGSRNWTSGPEITGSRRSIHRERLDGDQLEKELDAPLSQRSRVAQGLLALLDARARRPAFDPASNQQVFSPDGSGELFGVGDPANQKGSLFVLLRGSGKSAVLTVVNVSATPARCRIPSLFQPTASPFDPTKPIDPTKPSETGISFLDQGTLLVPALGTLWVDGRTSGGN